MILITGLVLVALHSGDRERKARADQTCTLFERAYASRVHQLSATYHYVLSLKPDERDSSLNRVIIQQIPQTRQEAVDLRPPDFCEQPGVGLKSIPPLPKVPPGLLAIIPRNDPAP